MIQEDKKKSDDYRCQSTDVSLKIFEWFSLSRRTNVKALKSNWDHSNKHFVWFCLLSFQTEVPDSETDA